MYNRRKFIGHSSLLGGFALLPWQKHLLSTFMEDAGSLTMLRKNVWVYTERGGSIGVLLSDDGIAVVDTQFKAQSENLIAKIKEKSERKIDLLINTHHHGDHTGKNIAFKGIIDQHVAHKNSKSNQERVAKARKQEATQLYPDTVFDSSWSKKVGSEIITMHYFGPAHTDGDSITHFENANIAHMGDLMFNRRFPFIDKSSGASIQGWIKVLSQAKKTFDKDTLFIFGHAGEGYEITGNLDDVKAFQNYLKKLWKFSSKAYKKGISQEELAKDLNFIPGAPEWKGGGLERSISAAYLELEEK